MTAILVMTHGRLGEEMLAAAAHVLGTLPPGVRALPVAPSQSGEEVVAVARAALAELGAPDGAVIFSDIFGATPCNAATRIGQDANVRVVAGVSLPMLVKALTLAAEAPQRIVEEALKAAQRGQVDIVSEAARGDA
ncbi:MAG: PTS fructose transporter subunit IIA [Burkholderiales bacterium]|nr:PTS fructose transporter subunit IIA [Burkholderiales bacterium]